MRAERARGAREASIVNVKNNCATDDSAVQILITQAATDCRTDTSGHPLSLTQGVSALKVIISPYRGFCLQNQPTKNISFHSPACRFAENGRTPRQVHR